MQSKLTVLNLRWMERRRIIDHDAAELTKHKINSRWKIYSSMKLS